MVRAMREDAVFGECREPTARARACTGRLTRVRLINVLRESRLRSAALRCALSGIGKYYCLLSSADSGTTPHGVQETTTDVDGSSHDKQNHRQVQLGMACLSFFLCDAMPMLMSCHVASGRLARSHGRVCI